MAAVFLAPSVARAEIDTFGLGDGHSGAKVVVGDEEINSYAGLTADAAAGATTLAISALAAPTAPRVAAPFANGDLVLVWRATGVAESAAPSGADTVLALPTAPSTPSNAQGLVGQYELARVETAAAGSLTLTKPLVNAYARAVSQVVRVPEYTTVNVPAGTSLRASAWQEIGGAPATPNATNPWAGGIVIFLATGAITIDNGATIHANARGFHGGVPAQRTINNPGLLNCDRDAVDGDPQSEPFSPKGQGVVHTRYAATIGAKGNVSIAGGGGNCVEAGGGGGANLGNGGAGSGTIANLGSGGEGGAGITYDVLTRLTMGGGGGAGRHLSGLVSVASLGGFGGGVVYVRGASMGGAGRIQANGGDGENSGIAGLPPGLTSEGSGGGGAGGTVVVRLAGTLDCDQLATPGGDGGSAQVLGLPVFGAGGGGGGGRVFFQATTKTPNCDIVVTPGNPGNGGQGGSQGGGPGGTQPPPAGGLCLPTTATATGTCVDPTPICDPVSGDCQPCSGPFGGGSPRACPVEVEPVCMTDGSCVPCNGDFGTGATQACQLFASPTCLTTGGLTGACGKCTTNADCAGPGHAGPVCNVNNGVCGTACTNDADCKTTEWCAPRAPDGSNVCIPKTPNGEPVPPFSPIDGECTQEKGERVCLSAVCEEIDDKCGKLNSTPCQAAPECRSLICFDADKKCGLPNGEPCTGDTQCRSDLCQGGTCTAQGCASDPDCPANHVCEAQLCVEGCRPGSQQCPPGQQCVAPDGGPVGSCVPAGDGGVPDGGSVGDGGPVGDGGLVDGDAGDTAGIIEGGGCACNSTTSPASSLSVVGAVASVLALIRRRKQRG
ncbi:MAG: hypothetical protein KIT84_34665 [Labilithrix sp.]|nr:hypothetical protein [Labilithrix sp.]